MLEKLKNVLTSIRFWQVTVVAVLQVLALYGLIPADLTNVISAWLGVTVLIGTVDKASKNIGNK